MNQRWFKSSSSYGHGACVEVRTDGPVVAVRDSKYRREAGNDPMCEPMILVHAAQWAVFLAEAAGEAPAGSGQAIAIEHGSDGTTTLRCNADGISLTYTPAEWEAFLDGVRQGEFTLSDQDALSAV